MTKESFTLPRAEQPVRGANEAHVVLQGLKKAAESKTYSGTAEQLKAVRLVRALIDQHIPALPPKEQLSNGLYSPAHLMAQSLELLERLATDTRPGVDLKAATAADETLRLLQSGDTTHDTTMDGTRGRRPSELTLPNLVEIPFVWRHSPEGKKFYANMESFVERRKKKVLVNLQDQLQLRESIDLMNNVVDASPEATRGVNEGRPWARDLILINLELLALETKKHQGKALPADNTVIMAIHSIRGLYNFNRNAAIAESKRPGMGSWTKDTRPAILETPRVLST